MSITATTTEDFRSTKVFAGAPDIVFTALTDIDASPAGDPRCRRRRSGRNSRFLMGDQEVVMRVEEADRPSRVRWSVLVCEPRGLGRELDHLRSRAGRHQHRAALPPQGLNPDLECFEHCCAGWTHYLASLVDYADLGAGSPNAATSSGSPWRAEHAAL